VTLLKEGVAVLSAEAKKREGADVDRGVRAFNAWLESARGRFQPLRKRAVTVQSKLDKAGQEACQKYSYQAFHKVLTRFSTVAAFYHSRIAVFRSLGDLFR